MSGGRDGSGLSLGRLVPMRRARRMQIVEPWLKEPVLAQEKKIHQSMDSISLCKPATKYSAEVDSAESIAEVMTNAFRSAEADRPDTAFVNLPMEIMLAAASCEVIKAPADSSFGPACSVLPLKKPHA